MLAQEELKLASQCIDYLNLPLFWDNITAEGVIRGQYAFMDYAVLNWVRHLEAGVVQADLDDEAVGPLIASLSESLDVFIEQHWKSPTARFAPSKRNTERLKRFQGFSFYDQLEQVVLSTRKQLTHFGSMREAEIALDISEIVNDARHELEALVSSGPDGDTQEQLMEMYGDNLFKCSRFSCQNFTTGFPWADERNKHVAKHDRPFICTEESCPSSVFGFASAAERDAHVKELHFPVTDREDEFPTDQEIHESIYGPHIEEDTGETIAVEAPDEEEELAEELQLEESQTMDLVEPPESPPEIQEPVLRRQKRERQTEFKCHVCAKVYTKRYNLTSHLHTHSTHRPFTCGVCGKGFARRSDHVRHLSTHTGERRHMCHGKLKNGTTWGCGRSFSRADILASHHKSRAGRGCILPLLEEQDQRIEELAPNSQSSVEMMTDDWWLRPPSPSRT